MVQINNKPKIFQRIQKYALLSLLLLFPVVAGFAQSGSIEGVITDKKTNEKLIGVGVFVDGTSIAVATDAEGKYVIKNLTSGKYKIKISYMSYKTVEVDNIGVSPSTAIQIDVSLESVAQDLNSVKVVSARRTSTEAAVLRTVKNSNSVANGVSSEMITKLQDRDAAEVVKRIPGVTIIDDKFIIVRGLSQRYNSVWLNNAATPSSEADSKAFSFDIIPSSMIDNIIVYKSSSADLPSDFSGGFIKVNTKSIPNQNSAVLSYSTGISQGTTFQNFYQYTGGKTDWLGYDDGTRAIPKDMPANLSEYTLAQNTVIQKKVPEIAKEMNNNWVPTSKKASPDHKLLLGVNRSFQLGESVLGNITSLSYSNTNDFTDIEKNNSYSIYSFQSDQLSPVDEFHDKQYTNNVKLGLMHNWAFYINQNNRLEFRNLFNQIGYTRTTMREGIEHYSDNHIRATELSYMSRGMYSGQLGGVHLFNDGATKADWTLGYSTTNKKEPDMKRYKYVRSTTDTTVYYLDLSNQLYSESRRWLDLNETLLSGALNLTQKLTFGELKPEIKAGIYFEKKDRNFNERSFGYGATGAKTLANTALSPDLIFTDKNFNLTDGVSLTENTDKSDSYTAGNNLMAGYLMFTMPISSKISLVAGVRAEKNKQFLETYRKGTSTILKPEKDTLNIFPSLNVTYSFTENSLLRFAYGKTINRPEFREMATLYFVDFNLNAGVQGNDSIKQAYIHSFDFRYEYYPSSDEIFSLGVFYKRFENAIEFNILGTNPTLYSFGNIKSAYSYGAEMELRKSLEFISMKDFDVLLNGSLIKSDIESGNGSLKRHRPLQGQSPYIVNAGLFYQNSEAGIGATLVYNVIGKRIVAVGQPSPYEWQDIPDIYESPRNMFDLTITKKIGKFIEIKGGIKDLLNEKVEFEQTVKTNVDMSLYGGSGTKYFERKQVNKLYYPGRYFTLGLTVKI